MNSGPVISGTVMGIPIQLYYENKKNFDEVQRAKLEDPTRGFGKPPDTWKTNKGYVNCHGPNYQYTAQSAFNDPKNHLHSPFRKQ